MKQAFLPSKISLLVIALFVSLSTGFSKQRPNIVFILVDDMGYSDIGCYGGEAVLTSTGDHGTQVHQILSNYQRLNNGGESWLRYMVFQPESDKIEVYTYNPALNKFKDGPSSRFDLDYPMTLPLDAASGTARPSAANDVNREVEQDGADQPATAPESKLDGDSEPPPV